MRCAVGGCHRSAEKRGWCGGHYYRWRKHGAPIGGRNRNGVHQKFLDEFTDPLTDECVLWPFPTATRPYAKTKDGHAHRIICKKFHGERPSDKHEVAHGCGNDLCINPRHLRWATPVENNADKADHGTQPTKLTRDQVIAIRASSDTCTRLSDAYGVSRSTISNVRTRKVWDRRGT